MSELCDKCGMEIPNDIQYCPHCGKSINSTKSDDNKMHQKSGLNWIFFLLSILLTGVLMYILATASNVNRQANIDSVPLDRNEIIINIISKNLDVETLDDDKEKLLKVLNDSQLKQETLASLSSIPTYIRGNPEILTSCVDVDTSGCINKDGIFILQQNSTELNDYMTIIYVHEALHAIYENKSADEKANINKMLTENYPSANERIKGELKLYGQVNSETWYSELHSRLGTEQMSLTPKLEEYYSTIFDKRELLPAAYTKIMDTVESAVDSCKVRNRNCDKAISYSNSLGTTKNPIVSDFQRKYNQ